MTILPILLAAAAKTLVSSNMPYSNFAASAADMRPMGGGWKWGGGYFNINLLDRGRGEVAIKMGPWTDVEPIYIAKRAGRLFVFLPPIDVAKPSMTPRPILAADCLLPIEVDLSRPGWMRLDPIDVPATLRVNPWLDGTKMEGCPAFLGNMSLADQQRLTIVTTVRGAIILHRARHPNHHGTSTVSTASTANPG